MDGMEQELEGLYVDLGQWKQIAAEEEELKKNQGRLGTIFCQSGICPAVVGQSAQLKRCLC